MSREARWERVGYQSRVDDAADQIERFVDAELATIDTETARSSPRQWAMVCRFFAGAAMAARAQGRTSMGGGKEMAAYLDERFRCDEEDGTTSGFEDFMDWLSNPAAFQPAGLREMLGS